MRITTCHISEMTVMQKAGWKVIDVTVKSGNKAFAPSWDIVMGYKEGRVSKEEYTRIYTEMMRKSFKENPEQWGYLFEKEALCLACYCNVVKGDFCHRTLLAEMIKKVADHKGIECEITPEGGSAFEKRLCR